MAGAQRDSLIDLLTWTQACVVRAAHALALATKDRGIDGADLKETAIGVSAGLLDVDAAITKGAPPPASGARTTVAEKNPLNDVAVRAFRVARMLRALNATMDAMERDNFDEYLIENGLDADFKAALADAEEIADAERASGRSSGPLLGVCLSHEGAHEHRVDCLHFSIAPEEQPGATSAAGGEGE